MDASRLKLLPPELRLYVYELALTEPEPVKVSFTETVKGNGERFARPTCQTRCGLLETCHEINNEGLPVFFKLNTFQLQLTESGCVAGSFAGEEAYKPMSGYSIMPAMWFCRALFECGIAAGGLRLQIGSFRFPGFGDLEWLETTILDLTILTLSHFNSICGELMIEFTLVYDQRLPLFSNRKGPSDIVAYWTVEK